MEFKGKEEAGGTSRINVVTRQRAPSLFLTNFVPLVTLDYNLRRMNSVGFIKCQ